MHPASQSWPAPARRALDTSRLFGRALLEGERSREEHPNSVGWIRLDFWIWLDFGWIWLDFDWIWRDLARIFTLSLTFT